QPLQPLKHHLKNSHRVAAGLATARKIKERSCCLSPVAVDVNHQLLVLIGSR
ncbi:hypothetical protein S245_051798, partial [Arachis hypogaea]